MSVSVIIPAYRDAASVGETVRAARTLPGVTEVIVVDDGSGDDTAVVAHQAGADRVIELARNMGKGAALRVGLEAARGDRVLFLDADLRASAARAEPLLEAIGSEAAMAIAVFPRQAGAGGGFGIARGLGRAVIRLFGGLAVAEPLSGQRALPAALARHLGLAPRFGVETALTVEAAHLGIPIREVPLPLHHQPTGRTVSGFVHRFRQFRDILRFALLLSYGLGWPALPGRAVVRRAALWAGGIAALCAAAGWVQPTAGRVTAVAALAAIVLWLPCLWLTAVELGLRKPNYLGRALPAAAGLVVPMVALPATWFLPALPAQRAALLVAVGLLGAAGLLDDAYASRRRARGLRGHLGALVRGRVTTGAVKAGAGLLAGAVAGYLLEGRQAVLVALDALLVALCANLVNLLDLRPGRALKGWGALCALAAAFHPGALALIGPAGAAALVAAPADLAGRVMLGDVGANTLGATAGLALARALPPAARVGAVALLAIVHLACERVSLSDIIARNHVLRALDRLGTASLPSFPPAGAQP